MYRFCLIGLCLGVNPKKKKAYVVVNEIVRVRALNCFAEFHSLTPAFKC